MKVGLAKIFSLFLSFVSLLVPDKLYIFFFLVDKYQISDAPDLV